MTVGYVRSAFGNAGYVVEQAHTWSWTSPPVTSMLLGGPLTGGQHSAIHAAGLPRSSSCTTATRIWLAGADSLSGMPMLMAHPGHRNDVCELTRNATTRTRTERNHQQAFAVRPALVL